jgi:prepilin-type N-terminal cleavage/methylation domain-containing protein
MMCRPNKAKGFTLVELMVVVGIVGIILAIALPYYISYKRASCDRAAGADIGKAAACIERLGNELVDLNLVFDNDSKSAQIYKQNLLQYLVGPYYGFRGGTIKCGVLMMILPESNRYILHGCALKGSHPAAQTSRYVYRSPIAGGGDLPATVFVQCGPDGADGMASTWNAYPVMTGPVETCYTESVVDATSGPTPTYGRFFTSRAPGSINCSLISGLD